MTKLEFDSYKFDNIPVNFVAFRRLKTHALSTKNLIEFYEDFYNIKVKGKTNKSRVIEAYIKYCVETHNLEWMSPSPIRCADFVAWLSK